MYIFGKVKYTLYKMRNVISITFHILLDTSLLVIPVPGPLRQAVGGTDQAGSN